MKRPTAFELAKMMSDLTGRPVQVAEAKADSVPGAKAIYALYEQLPSGQPLLVEADVAVLASMAGLLLGFPPAAAVDMAKEEPMDASVYDGIKEILNICSTSLSPEPRVVLEEVTTNRTRLKEEELKLLTSLDRSHFKVTVGGKDQGCFNVFKKF